MSNIRSDMNYLFITGPLNTGGAERVLLDLLRNFDYGKHSVHLCQIVDGGVLDKEIPAEVKRIPLWCGYSLGYRIAWNLSHRLGIHVLLRHRFKNAIKDEYDVAISFLEGAPLRVHYLCNPKAKRHVSWVHVDLNEFPYELVQFRSQEEENQAYAYMDRVVNVAQDTQRGFEKRFPSLKEKACTIYNPIDIGKVQRMAAEAEIKHESFTVLFLGRLSSPKNPQRFIRVASILKQRGLGLQFILMGNGDLHDELQGMIQELQVQDMVKMIPFSPNPFPHLKAADVLLSTSIAEGFGLVHCEAMALGTPVISTKTAGPTEILKDNEYGMLCEHDDEAIADAVQRLYEDEELRKHYAEAGLSRVQDFDIQKALDAVYQL